MKIKTIGEMDITKINGIANPIYSLILGTILKDNNQIIKVCYLHTNSLVHR